MARRGDLRAGLSIARIELLRSLRTVLGDRRRVASGLFVVVAVTVPYLGVIGGLYAAGVAVAVGDLAVATAVRGAFPGLLAGLVLLATVQRVAESSVPDGAALLLTAARTRAVVVGELVSSGVTLYGTVAVLAAPGLAAFALGAGSPATVPVALLVAAPVVTTATVAGYLLAATGALLARRLPHVTGLKFGAYVGGMLLVAMSGPALAEAVEGGATGVLEPLAAVPVADYALLALLGTPTGAATPVGLVTGGALVALTAVGAGAAVPIADRLWFTDAATGDRRVVERHAEVPRPFAATPALRVAWHYLLFAWRAPRRLVHLTVFVFLLFPVAGVAAANPGAIPLAGATTLCVIGTLLSGAAFGLNPLGDEGAVLPALLTAGVGGRRLVRGRLVAGLAVGLPLAVLGAGGVWVDLALPVRVGLGVVGGAVALSVLAGCVGLGLGCAIPKFESESIFGLDTVHPSRIPVMLYVYGGLVAVPLGLGLVAVPPGAVVDATVHYGALAAYAVVVCGLAAVGYVYAVRRIDGYTY